MKKKLLEILVCPKCHGPLALQGPSEDGAGDVVSGDLSCRACPASYPIVRGIPRFVSDDNYSSSFGFQWNKFRREQIDSFNGTELSKRRFWSETLWDAGELRGRWMIDLGCGAGRFLDVSSVEGVEAVGIDISNAVDAAKENLAGRDNVHLVQASIYELPFADGTFDNCYCIGVIQHTPDPVKSLGEVGRLAKSGGKVAVTIYPRKFYTKLYSKYWLRPLTKRLRKESLLRLIEFLMPVLFPLTDVLFRVPVLGKVFAFVIPVANYVEEKSLSRSQRYAWAVLDTFDMLSPQFDSPMTRDEAFSALSDAGVRNLQTHSTGGLNVTGIKN